MFTVPIKSIGGSFYSFSNRLLYAGICFYTTPFIPALIPIFHWAIRWSKPRLEGEYMKVKAQLYIQNDLFKVMDLDRIIPEIYYPLVKAKIPLIEMLSNEGGEEEALRFQPIFQRLIFIYEGKCRYGDIIIARYQFKGGE